MGEAQHGVLRWCITFAMERFWSKVEKTPTCWIWRGGRFKNGYGAFRFRGRVEYAHRVAFFLAHGRWPKPLGMHACDVHACVRVHPRHVGEGTHAMNSADMVAKGRQRARAGEEHPRAKLTAALVRTIRRRAAAGEGQRALAREYGVNIAQVNRIVHRRLWRGVR